MLIKKTENNGEVDAIFESSNIVASTYKTNTEELTIVFKTGMSYTYNKVSKKDYSKFELAESQGQVFNKYIKQHTFTKGGPVDVSALALRLEEAKEEERKLLRDNIVQMATKLSLVEDHQGFESTLEMLETLIRLRKEKLNEGK